MKVQKFKRGQIWWYEYNGTQYDGSVMGKTRPVIIVSNDAANAFSNCLIGIPCTTQEKKDMPTHLTTSIHGTRSTLLAENLISININRLTDFIGVVDDELMNEINNILAVAVGLKECDKYQDTVDSTELTQYNSTSETSISLTIDNRDKELVKPIDTKLPSVTKLGRRPKMTEEEKHRFLEDYENHTIDFMLKKYNLKDVKAAQQKVYLIRKEFGLRVRNR